VAQVAQVAQTDWVQEDAARAIAADRLWLTRHNIGAQFDPTGRYRYALWREWNASRPRLTVVMLNPSTADAERDDPTIRRCVQFAQGWGYGSLEVVNLFAYRATCPAGLQQVPDPVGDDNDRALLGAAERAAMLLVAWGNWGQLYGRDRTVLALLAATRPLYCLGINHSGQPRHPLYLRADTQPMLFQVPDPTLNPIPNPAIDY
jgi:hypothetical protein